MLSVYVAHQLPGSDMPSCSAQEEAGGPRSKLQREPATHHQHSEPMLCLKAECLDKISKTQSGAALIFYSIFVFRVSIRDVVCAKVIRGMS